MNHISQRLAANAQRSQIHGIFPRLVSKSPKRFSTRTIAYAIPGSQLTAFTESSQELLSKELGRLDAVIVLGGGLRISENAAPLGDIPPWAVRRLDGAAQVWSASGVKIAISGGGSPHGLPVIHPETGQVVHEGTAYADYLMRRHAVPSLNILKESSSYDTVGNGYFSAMIHAVPSQWKRIAVVTSEFHMPRSRAIFEKIYHLVNESLYSEDEQQISLVFASVKDEGIFDNPRILEARKQKEMSSMVTWENNVKSITHLHDFHEWFYSTHVCYSCSRQEQFGIENDVDARIKESY